MNDDINLEEQLKKLEEELILKESIIKGKDIEIERLKILLDKYANPKKDYYSIEYVDKINELDFMNYMTNLLTELKFEKVKITTTYENYEFDVLATKDLVNYLFKCKLSNNVLGEEIIDSTLQLNEHAKRHVAVVVTNNIFTTSAIKYAEKNNVLLWDRKLLEEYIKQTKKENPNDEIILGEDTDPFYEDVVKYAVEIGTISASLIQRKFKLGYNRATRLIDTLEEKGVIGPCRGIKPREVIMSNSNTQNDKEEELFNQMKEYLIEVQKATTPLLQRRFRIGYAQAARMMDLLEERGVVGPYQGSRPREVLIKID